jgi:choice-of-anchor A domain-containing protein
MQLCRGWTRLAAAATVAAGLSTGAEAATFNDFSFYSAVIFGDMTHSDYGDTEKSLAVGGNLTLNGSYGIANIQPNGRLNVGGNFQNNVGTQIGNNPIGSGYVGGTYAGNFITAGNAVGGPGPTYGKLPTGNPNFNFGGITSMNAVKSLFQASSQAWNGLSGVATGLGGGNVRFAKSAGSTFFVSAGDLAAASNWIFEGFSTSDTILVNVTGNLDKTGGDMQLNGASAGKVLFNFVDATSVKTTNFTFKSTVVAAIANLTGSGGNIEGQLFANGYVGKTGHEIHSASFTGDLAVTPIPAALPLLASALGALGYASRRRNAA